MELSVWVCASTCECTLGSGTNRLSQSCLMCYSTYTCLSMYLSKCVSTHVFVLSRALCQSDTGGLWQKLQRNLNSSSHKVVMGIFVSMKTGSGSLSFWFFKATKCNYSTLKKKLFQSWFNSAITLNRENDIHPIAKERPSHLLSEL